MSPVLYSHRGLIERSFDSKIQNLHSKYPPYTQVPFYGSSKIAHGNILGKVRGGIIKGKYWSRKFSGGFHKQYDGGIISGQYAGVKGLYRGQIVRRTRGGHLYRGIYKQYSKTTFVRGTLFPSDGNLKTSSGFIKQRWLPKKLYLGSSKNTLPLKRYHSDLPKGSHSKISSLPWLVRRPYPRFSQSTRPKKRYHAISRKSTLPFHRPSNSFYRFHSGVIKPNLLDKKPYYALSKINRGLSSRKYQPNKNKRRILIRVRKPNYRNTKLPRAMKQRAYPTGRKNPFPIVILKRIWTPRKKTPVVNRRVNLIHTRPLPKDHEVLQSANKDRKLNREQEKKDGMIDPISSRKRKFIRRFIRKLKKTREQYRTNKTKSSLY